MCQLFLPTPLLQRLLQRLHCLQFLHRAQTLAFCQPQAVHDHHQHRPLQVPGQNKHHLQRSNNPSLTLRSGASTSGTTPQAQGTKSHNLRQRSKVDYKDLNTGASQFGRAEFRKQCSRAGASVRKSVAKVRKMSLANFFPPISQNSSSSSMASSK